MRLVAVTLAAMMISGPAFAGDAEDAYGVVKKFIDGFNTGDVEGALTACAPSVAIIDEFAPYAWNGEGACAAWANDFDADARKKGLSDAIVTLHPARHAFVDGDHAYVVSPVDYSYRIGDKKGGQTGSTLTSALEKMDGEWKITQWAWSQGKPKK